MPIELKLGGQLLVASPTESSFLLGLEQEFSNSTDQFVITMDSGDDIPVRSVTVASNVYGGPDRKSVFATWLSDLPAHYGKVYRTGAELMLRQIADQEPRYRAIPKRKYLMGLLPNRRKPVEVETPPTTVDLLEDDYLVPVLAHGLHERQPCIKTGQMILLGGRAEYGLMRMGFGAITALTVT